VIHDAELLQRLESMPTVEFSGTVFRATLQGHEALMPSQRGGRWAPPGQISALYTSLARDGAIAEVAYHWSQQTPLPRKAVMDLHEIEVSTRKSLRLIEVDLPALGVVQGSYRATNYPVTQAIGAAVEFLECDGLLVPSARWDCENLVLFINNHDLLEQTLEVRNSAVVDWQDWLKHNAARIK
jgi:RES domain-containing protein